MFSSGPPVWRCKKKEITLIVLKLVDLETWPFVVCIVCFNSVLFVPVCEYYVHSECADFAAPDCRENATYVPDVKLAEVRHRHHWREGNLPAGGKCVACRRACWSAECLTGYRCEWCGITVSISILT